MGKMQKSRYSIGKKLKEGGFGSIYMGFDNELNIPIAIKIIHTLGIDPIKQYKIAHDDAMIASKLRGHPNIVDVYGFKKSSTNKYIILMEYINGYSLVELRNLLIKLNISLPNDFALYIVSQSCEGLEYAHTRMNESDGMPINIIHRDISPSNIMLSFEGYVKIIDFGIAKGGIREQSETGSGLVKGKLTYMAPEQLKDIPYDHRVDIYSLGIVMLELLTGERLYKDTDNVNIWTLMQNVAKQNVDVPDIINKHNIAGNIRSIIYKAIAVDPLVRYASASDMQADIIKALSNKSETSLRQGLAKFLRETKRGSKKCEQKDDVFGAPSIDNLETVNIDGDMPDEKKEEVIEEQELSTMSDIITPTSTPTPKYEKLRYEHNLERLQEMVDERNKFVQQSRRADPISGLEKIENWAAHNKLSKLIKLDLDGKKIRLTIDRDKLYRIEKTSMKEEADASYYAPDEKEPYTDIIHDEQKELVSSSSVMPIEKTDESKSISIKRDYQKTVVLEAGDLEEQKIAGTKRKYFQKLLIISAGIVLLITIGILGTYFMPKIFVRSFKITSYPAGAEVTIGGETYGVTPVTLPPSQKKAEISLSLSGFPNISEEVNFGELKQKNIPFIFHKFLKISSNSERAQIYINEENIGYSEDTLIEEWKVNNPLNVQAYLEGYDPLKITMKYTEDGTFDFSPNNVPWLGVEAEPNTPDIILSFEFGQWVEFATDPPGAEFKDLNEKTAYTDSEKPIWYPEGKYPIYFKKEGYKTASYSLIVGPNFEKPELITLFKVIPLVTEPEPPEHVVPPPPIVVTPPEPPKPVVSSPPVVVTAPKPPKPEKIPPPTSS